MADDEEERRLRSAALQNVQSILQARQRAEQELVETKEALEEETRILELLNATGATLASNLDLQSVVQAVTDAATALSGATLGAFFLRKGASAAAPTAPYAISGLPPGTPLVEPADLSGGLVRIADVLADPRCDPRSPFGASRPARSFLAVPVVARSGEVLGRLCFGHPQAGAFTERSERLIVGVAAQAAIAIDNARLYEEARRSADERSRLLDAERANRAEIERVSLMKDEFLATLSHELRTPLNVVLGWSEVLLSRPESDPETRRGLETIARNARSQAQLIDDLLDMNRNVSGKIRLEVLRVDLAAIVDAAVDSVRPSADARAITLSASLLPGGAEVVGDPDRLQQVVWNLLTNAVKFTPLGGEIAVAVRREGAFVEVCVSDTGVGVSPEFLPHLFERFRQADSSTTRPYGGLGLGLSIVKQLVELHGGSVTAESGGEGRGSTFVVALPASAYRPISSPPRGHRALSIESARGAHDVTLAGVAVLVVDDEPDALELARSVLTAAGAEVLTAASADEGLAYVESRRPHVIVSDIGMPERDGYQFMRDVRSLGAAAGGGTPAIALTAFARADDRERATLAGYQVHLAKPLRARDLVAAVRELCLDAGRGVR